MGKENECLMEWREPWQFALHRDAKRLRPFGPTLIRLPLWGLVVALVIDQMLPANFSWPANTRLAFYALAMLEGDFILLPIICRGDSSAYIWLRRNCIETFSVRIEWNRVKSCRIRRLSNSDRWILSLRYIDGTPPREKVRRLTIGLAKHIEPARLRGMNLLPDALPSASGTAHPEHSV
ncbi:MAG TPA: hypothetical protein VGP72_20075 [Planctomycetota bacterium]|jgi:hypothetical protein